jgi:Holliday junction resolvase RusA-like endonuclease
MIDQLEVLEFWVEGVPVPQGSKKAFVVGRRAVIVDANKDQLKPWRATVKNAAENAVDGRPGFDDAVCVLLDFYMPRGKSVLRRRPSVKPDADKLARAILDSLTDSGALSDDSRVVSLHIEEWYADDKPGVNVKVRALA